MNLTTGINPYRTSTYSSNGARAYQRSATSQPSRPVDHGDSVTLSASATDTKHNGKMMAILGTVGTVVGLGAALLIPGAGVGAVLLSGLVGGVAGTAIGDGALKDAGTKPARPFDPYNPSDILNPDNLYHPRNPFNPLNFPDYSKK